MCYFRFKLSLIWGIIVSKSCFQTFYSSILHHSSKYKILLLITEDPRVAAIVSYHLKPPTCQDTTTIHASYITWLLCHCGPSLFKTFFPRILFQFSSLVARHNTVHFSGWLTTLTLLCVRRFVMLISAEILSVDSLLPPRYRACVDHFLKLMYWC